MTIGFLGIVISSGMPPLNGLIKQRTSLLRLIRSRYIKTSYTVHTNKILELLEMLSEDKNLILKEFECFPTY